MTDRPRRTEEVDVNPVADGCVVYDAARDRVHYLNHTAALVLEFCDGQKTSADIGRMLQVAFDLAEPPEEEVRDCIERLREEALVT